MARIRPPFKYHGGKFFLCDWIVSNIPSHETYVEPFGGAASVLLNKPRCNREIYNDLNSDLANLMRFIRDDFDRLKLRLQEISCEESVYYTWKSLITNDVFDSAVRAYVLYRMSRGGNAGSFSKSKRTYGGIPENISSWKSSIENLKRVSERLQGVEIRCECAFKLIEEFSSPDVIFYLDPPYVKSSRVSPKIYKLEMMDADHTKLAEICKKSNSKILLSGYNSDLYLSLFKDWSYENKIGCLHASHGKKKQLREEILWKNFNLVF